MAEAHDSGGQTAGSGPIVEFGALATRLAMAAGILAVGAFIGVVVQGVRSGLTFGLMFQWAAIWLLVFVLVGGVLVALHALGGASQAQAQGERLSSEGIGLFPPRKRNGGPEDPQDPEEE